jgi:hypothetical protein
VHAAQLVRNGPELRAGNERRRRDLRGGGSREPGRVATPELDAGDEAARGGEQDRERGQPPAANLAAPSLLAAKAGASVRVDRGEDAGQEQDPSS